MEQSMQTSCDHQFETMHSKSWRRRARLRRTAALRAVQHTTALRAWLWQTSFGTAADMDPAQCPPSGPVGTNVQRQLQQQMPFKNNTSKGYSSCRVGPGMSHNPVGTCLHSLAYLPTETRSAPAQCSLSEPVGAVGLTKPGVSAQCPILGVVDDHQCMDRGAQLQDAESSPPLAFCGVGKKRRARPSAHDPLFPSSHAPSLEIPPSVHCWGLWMTTSVWTLAHDHNKQKHRPHWQFVGL